jgi:hypothetical protein
VAVNWSVAPSGTEAFVAVTTIEASVATVTAIFAVPFTPPEVAWIVVLPAPTPVARPPAPIVATPVFDEVHVTVAVRFCVVPSENVPVAVNWSVVPLAMEAFAAVTAIDTKVAAVTCSVADWLTAPEVAWIVALPTPMPVASPLAEIVATPAFDEAHVTELVTSCVVPSLIVPVALNWVVSPFAMLRFVAVREMDCRVDAPLPELGGEEGEEEEEQLLMTKIAQTQKMSRPILLIEPKNTPRD